MGDCGQECSKKRKISQECSISKTSILIPIEAQLKLDSSFSTAAGNPLEVKQVAGDINKLVNGKNVSENDQHYCSGDTTKVLNLTVSVVSMEKRPLRSATAARESGVNLTRKSNTRVSCASGINTAKPRG